MRKIHILVMLLLCLILPGVTEAQLLERKVSLQYNNITIEEALKDITKKYGVNFSYSSSVVPLKKRITISVKDKSLNVALKELFKETDITYQAVGSQVVLKKSPKKNVPAGDKSVLPVNKEETLAEADSAEEPHVDSINNSTDNTITTSTEQIISVKDTVVYFPEPEFQNLKLTDTLDKASLRKQYMAEKKRLRDQYNKKMDSLDRSGSQSSKVNLKDEFNRVSKKLKTKIETLRDSLSTISIPKKDTANSGDSSRLQEQPSRKDSSSYVYKPWQITFVPPIGTNGIRAGQTVNHVSWNILAGRSAGLEGFELGSLLNIEKDFSYGAQISGFGNIVGGDVTGGQVAGFMNINQGYTRAYQMSGFINFVSDSVFGLQFAGFTNIVTDRMKGGQTAGFMNISRRKHNGAQVAGFLNVADTIKGAQVAGFLNVAKRVKGAQIGIINIADTVTGAQFGVISFGGYRKLEIWGSETLYGNIAFKTGSRYLYNIFALGVLPKGSDITLGIGYGLGSEIKISKRTIVNLDALAYSIHHEGFGFKELNLLNQFRATFGYLLTKNTSVFIGPTYNVMVSEHYNSETGAYGSPISPEWNFYNKTEDKLNVTMWVGLNAGIRF